MDVRDKPNGAGPVTAADLQIDAMLRERLTAARPGYGWLSEETPDTGDRLADRLARSHVFIVDPIDGTRAFIDGSRQFAHSLAIARDGQVTAGVVYLPLRQEMFTAALGRGAALNGRPLVASTRTGAEGATILTTRSNLRADCWPGGSPAVVLQFRPSLAFRLALVGQGRCDGALTLRDSWEWDVAAGGLIAAEAGAFVSTRKGGVPRFNTPVPLLPGIVAAAPGVHAQLVARLTLPAA